MKKSITLFTALFLFVLNAEATIWRVNNNAGVDADFEDIDDALNSSSVVSGDTLHIEPSNTNYANATLTKALVIIGPGYFLDPESSSQPYNPGLQADTRRAYINTLNIDGGAEGSKILGLSFNSVNFRMVTENVSVERCLTGSISFSQSGRAYEGFKISKCFMTSTISHHSSISSISKITIENCIFGGGSSGIRLTMLSGNQNVVRNNVIHGRYFEVPNCYVANNIYWHSFVGYVFTYDFTNSVIKNNIFSPNPTLPATATDNLVSVDMNSVFVQGSGSLDSFYQLVAETSPAIGHGVTIAGYTPDAGAFGGPDPYRLSGIPPIPTIYSLTAPNDVNPGDDLEVTFSTRNNN